MISSASDNGNNGLHHLLIVDDEEAVLASLRDTLSREGYRVTTAPSAVEALPLLRSQSFSAVITDQCMPGLTGLEFLHQVRELQPDATRILITAVLSLGVVIDAINKGEIYRFIVKPWLREELIVTVRNAVQRYELIARNATLQATLIATNHRLVEANERLESESARIAAQHAELATLKDALDHSLQHSVELCLRTMETFYPTLGHQARRVHALCQSMAEALGLDEHQRRILGIAAWLHDIGLVGIPRAIIRKWESAPGTLSEAELALVHQHPVHGQELADFGPHLAEVGTLIRAHHEHFDGSGYPDRLQGEQIPWLARILAVAVAYAESHRDSESTLEAIRQLKGQTFDPEAVRVLFRAIPKAAVPRRQEEVLLSELRPGMIIARGIYNASGLLLVPDGQRLTETAIDKLNNHNRVNPIAQSLMVYS